MRFLPIPTSNLVTFQIEKKTFADSGKQTNTETSSLLTCGVENVSHTRRHIDVPGGVER